MTQDATTTAVADHTELFVRPTENNTVISLITMDTAYKTYLTERCLRSIRARGNFNGYIIVLTDHNGFPHYSYTLSWNPKVIVIQGKKEDMRPCCKSRNGRRRPIQ
jgi:hypothetical protein